MRKWVAGMLMVAMLLAGTAVAAPQTIDLETMTTQELTELRAQVDAALTSATAQIVEGYILLDDYAAYARTPEAHIGEAVQLNGVVIQVSEGVESTIYRIAKDGDVDQMFYVTYTPGVESTRVLEDDKVTVVGEFTGLTSYQSVLGGTITIPAIAAQNILEQVVEAGEYPATREDPAPIGATVRYDGQSYYNESVVDITVTQVVRADAAWEMVRGFNRYNDKPDENQEYIIAYVHTAAIESLDGKAADISDYDFSFISASGVQYDHTSVAGKTPELKTLFEGAEYEGLVIGLIEKGDHPFLVYLPSSDNPLWFDLNRRVPIELPEDMVFEVLENGSRGEAVQRLQAMLVEMGYLSGAPDGVYGKNTAAAVAAYQQAMNLEATGIADEQTQRLILTATYPET